MEPKAPLAAQTIPKTGFESSAAPSGPIPLHELRRDRRVFRSLRVDGLPDYERARLFALARGEGKFTRADYNAYQAKLLELAEARGIPIRLWSADHRPEAGDEAE